VSVAAKNLVMIKWEKFRYPYGRNSTGKGKSSKKDAGNVFISLKSSKDDTSPRKDAVINDEL
jgi:hypothetical protein